MSPFRYALHLHLLPMNPSTNVKNNVMLSF